MVYAKGTHEDGSEIWFVGFHKGRLVWGDEKYKKAASPETFKERMKEDNWRFPRFTEVTLYPQ